MGFMRFMIASAILLAATMAAAGPIPLDRARRTFEDVRIVSDDDGGKLWGRPLYGPMLLVDPQTRYVVANQPDAGGVLKREGEVFTGTLPPDVVIANTATEWSGVRWTMVMWGSVSSRSVPRRRLLIHESFHRIQNELGFPGANTDNPHLASVDGRYWYLLEVRALASALRGDNRPAAIADALAFRAKRRSLFPTAAASERALETNEGLAEYTGVVLRGTGDEETRFAVARRLETTDLDESFVRSFAYSTGPAYGLLLDATDPKWRASFTKSSDLGEALAAAAKVTAATDPEARASAYGGVALRADEEHRAAELAMRIAAYRARLVDGPTIEIPLEAARYAFDPYTVVPLGADGIVYPSLNVSGAWGTLATESGARRDEARGVLVFAAVDRSKLKLSPGWTLVAGRRKGDLVLSAPPK